jgi:hypothetical protein
VRTLGVVGVMLAGASWLFHGLHLANSISPAVFR